MTDNKKKKKSKKTEEELILTIPENELYKLAVKIVSRMVKLKSMEDWFNHVNNSEDAWQVYKELDLSEEVNALGEAARLMTIMEICKQDEQYEKCAIIKNRMEEINKILRKYK